MRWRDGLIVGAMVAACGSPPATSEAPVATATPVVTAAPVATTSAPSTPEEVPPVERPADPPSPADRPKSTRLPADPPIPDGPMPLHLRREAARRAHIAKETRVEKDDKGVRVTEIWTYNVHGDPVTHRATIRRGGVMTQSWTYAGPQQPSRHRYRDAQQAWTATFSYGFDAEGRLAKRTRQVSTGEAYSWTTSYSPDGGYTTRSGSSVDVYDARGLRVRDCGGGSCMMASYDENGHLHSRRIQQGADHNVMHVTSTADAEGRLVEQKDGGTLTTYRRNARGDVVEAIDRLGGQVQSTTTYSYVYR